MKKIFRIFFLLLFTVILSNCQNDDELNISSDTSTISFENDIAIIKTLGFDVTNILDQGDYYRVENDIVLEKKYLNDYGKIDNDSIQLRQAVYSKGKIDQNKVSNITIGFSSSFPTTGRTPEWRTALSHAINEWNSISNCAIKFILTASSPNVTIEHFREENSNTVAEAYMPRSGNPGEKIKINIVNDYYSMDSKIHVLVHEMGHILGFRHTDGDTDSILIPGTSSLDPLSVMNSTYGDNSGWKGFTQQDIKATQILYPGVSSLTSSAQILCPGETVTYTVPEELINTSPASIVYWTEISNATFVSYNGTRGATFRVSGNGHVVVKAAIRRTNIYQSTTQEIINSSVWVGVPEPKSTLFEPTLTEFYPNTVYYASPTSIPMIPGTSYSIEVVGGAKIYGDARAFRFITDSNIKGGTFSLVITAHNKCGSKTKGYAGTIKGQDRPGPIVITRMDNITTSTIEANNISYSIRIFDLSGKLVYTKNNVSGQFDLRSTSLYDGIYIIEKYDGENITRDKVIFKR